MTEVTAKVERAIARFDRVTQQLDQRGGSARQAARRERQRLNSDMMSRARQIAIAVVVIAALTVVVGLIKPIGMFGFLGAIALLLTAVVVLAVRRQSGASQVAAPSPDLPNGTMVDRFDSYIYRVRAALPAPAQAQIDAISAALPPLKETLERVDTLDPRAQDARRLMSIHLPGLVDRYRNVPAAFRSEEDGEGKTVDQRLVESLAAARTALGEVSEQLARQDLAAFETQGRFIASRYGEEAIESDDRPSA